MLFKDYPVLIRGGGDLATGVAYRLNKAGFPVIVLELPQPLVVRRRVALAAAVSAGQVQVESLVGQLVPDLSIAWKLAEADLVPVVVAPELPAVAAELPGRQALILVDGRMAKRKLDTRIDQADLVIALGPGFSAGLDCQAVIETKRGHTLGRVIWQGPALANTGIPGQIGGKGAERILRAPVAGLAEWSLAIGDRVTAGQQIGSVAGQPVTAPFDGVIRGLIASGTRLTPGLKIGDVDPRADPAACSLISDKALAIGGGALEAVLTWLNQRAHA